MDSPELVGGRYSVRWQWSNTEQSSGCRSPLSRKPLLAAPNVGAIVGLLFGHAEQVFAGGFCYPRKGHFLLHNGKGRSLRFSNQFLFRHTSMMSQAASECRSIETSPPDLPRTEDVSLVRCLSSLRNRFVSIMYSGKTCNSRVTRKNFGYLQTMRRATASRSPPPPSYQIPVVACCIPRIRDLLILSRPYDSSAKQ
jgi:hypothetical protein